jgi:hypothetical protein
MIHFFFKNLEYVRGFKKRKKRERESEKEKEKCPRLLKIGKK